MKTSLVNHLSNLTGSLSKYRVIDHVPSMINVVVLLLIELSKSSYTTV